MNYREALAWLYSTQRFGIKLGLENAERLFAALRLPSTRSRIVHVAGTNGKGSVCALAAAICRAEGYRTGLYTSPHLVTFRERIQVDADLIDESAVAVGLTTIRDLIRAWDPHPTFFEITTALGLLYFAKRDCEIVILETGLGGRLDATNAVSSDVSVLTPIALDHQAILGHTTTEIAAEKAGIIKEGIPVVSAEQEPSVEAVLQARVAACRTSLRTIDQPYRASAVGLRGEHQKMNAALAIAALAAAKIHVGAEAIAQGLATVVWPARFQSWDEQLIIDGAHNEASAEVLAETWRDAFGPERALVIFGALKDKEIAAIWRALAPIAHRVFLPRFSGERARLPEEVRPIVEEVSPQIEISEFPSITAAISEARRFGRRILLTGSLHFAGEALASLRGDSTAFEECAQ